MPRSLLDTDVLSAILRANPVVTTRAGEYLAQHGALTFSIITRYEVLRGLKAKNATTQLEAFERFCGTCEILPLTDEVVLLAAGIYADLKQ